MSVFRRGLYALAGLACGLIGGGWFVASANAELGAAAGRVLAGVILPFVVIAAGGVLINTALYGRRR